ncbi:hypothetical protein Q75_00395 [Bacillus coahuilensis p1.1.43]|uniref:HTH merR-type domain-containing protein n=1 Tax=Bacillus coahuilensis p1.1.43 TaxID=1150625 RepID=A0A147KCJ5_9BACI|nr:MerR family transcriptional regulator [Bacillus coahuilensis]KUP09418.1 hypothetical protein Q75_00395 [Bacillus coahuilensis p1.1.43]
MYKIGEFSKITSLTVKTLHYYDDEGILKPAERQKDTGYRYYNEKDFKKAQLIRLLRAMDFSIAEIKDVMGQYEEDMDVSYFIREKRQILEGKIQSYRAIQKKMDAYLTPEEKGEIRVKHEIIEKTTDQQLIAALRFNGKYEDTGTYIGKLFKAVKMKAMGKPFSLYYDDEFKDFGADIEVCLPVKSEVKGNDITTRTLASEKVISTIHIGPYETIHLAYKALTDYANEHGIEYETPFREIYIKAPGMILKGNPNKYETEVQFVVKA